MASALEMTDQMSVATTRLDESRVWREVRSSGAIASAGVG